MKRHDIDVLSLVFGVVFLAMAATGLFDRVDFAPIEARWVWPTVLIVAGAIVLATSVRRPVVDADGDSVTATPVVDAPVEPGLFDDD